MFYLSIFFYYGIVGLLPLFLWFNKRNLHFLLNLPLIIIAFFLGAGYFLDSAINDYGIPYHIISSYQFFLIISGFVTAGFLFLGFYIKTPLNSFLNNLVFRFSPNHYKLIFKYGLYLSIVTIILFCISYVGMGFAPALTESPMSAKFFAGEYQEPYRPFAIPFRLALLFSQLALTLLLLKLFLKYNLRTLILFLAIFTLLLLSLRRGPIAYPILTFFISYFIFKKKWLFWPSFITYFLIFALGSASLKIFLNFIGLGEPLNLSVIFWGVPDLIDHLHFLDFWIGDNWDPTYGLTIIGGLIPFQFKYNPATLSKIVVGMEETAATGGFRLPIPLLGYISFGWLGLVLFSAIHGFLTGVVLKISKVILTKAQSFDSFIVYFLIINILFGLTDFVLNAQVDFLVSIIFLLFLFKLSNYKLKIL